MPPKRKAKVTQPVSLDDRAQAPPKKKAKKRSRAYLDELKKLKRTERKYVIGDQETAEFKLYVNRKGEKAS